MLAFHSLLCFTFLFDHFIVNMNQDIGFFLCLFSICFRFLSNVWFNASIP